MRPFASFSLLASPLTPTSSVASTSTRALPRRPLRPLTRTTPRRPFSSARPPPRPQAHARALRFQRSAPLSLLLLTGTAAAWVLMPSASASSGSEAFADAGDPSASPLPSVPGTLASTPFSTLLRSYAVWTITTLPGLIDYSPSILHAMTHSPVPGLKALTESLVRATFFAQFVPGESAEECEREMRALRARNVGSVLNYSAEVGVDEAVTLDAREIEDMRMGEVERALDRLAAFEEWVFAQGGEKGSSAFALKVTGLVDPEVLRRASTTLHRLHAASKTNSASSPKAVGFVPYPAAPTSIDRQVLAREAGRDSAPIFALKGAVPEWGVLETDEGLRAGDVDALRELWRKLVSLGDRAKRNGIKLMIDAEHTPYQPALDSYTLLLSEMYNRPPHKSLLGGTDDTAEWRGPLIFGTYQSYLVRAPQYLVAMLKHAEQNGYALGLKVVRGAYFMQERATWKSENRLGPDPIWPDKPATDLSYNSSLSTILSTLSAQLASPHPERALSVVFGTHNPESVQRFIDGVLKHGLAKKNADGLLELDERARGKVFVAQLYGMKDDLMDRVVGAFEPSGMPVALKYIAYGKLSEVMPFLGRRAIENKSLMSGDHGAAAERKRVGQEIWRRLFG